MCRILLIAILGFASVPACAEETERRATSLIADALDWYSVWWGLNSKMPGGQTCRGEFRRPIYILRCDPLSVAIGMEVDRSGRCYFTNMSPIIGAVDSGNLLGFGDLDSYADEFRPRARDCGELPIKEGKFSLTIVPRSRNVDHSLTVQARDAALQYFKRAGSRCLLRFPYVKDGDPFFHVYEECQGKLSTVSEFPIRNGRADDFPQWVYYPERGGFPTGEKWREKQLDLWFGTSQSAEKKSRSKNPVAKSPGK